MLAGERGNALLMVIVILLMGTVLLRATQRQLDDRLSLASDERRYIHQYALATSSLAWGEKLRWHAAAEGYCQHQQRYGWRACLIFRRSGWLLRGDSGEGTLAVFRWVNQQSNSRIRAVPHGWLDYCPLADWRDCDVL